jgi:hypothetical protein
MDTTITRKQTALPQGVKFEDINSGRTPEPQTEGTAYTHFFPHGLSEPTIVHLQDNSKHHTSLVINPLLGETEVYGRYVNEAESQK